MKAPFAFEQKSILSLRPPHALGMCRDLDNRMSNGLGIAPENSEGWYRSIFEQSSSGIFVVRADGSLVECNCAFAETLGYTAASELLAAAAGDLFFDVQERANFLAKLRRRVR